jgi:hypothetical protein
MQASRLARGLRGFLVGEHHVLERLVVEQVHDVG